MRAIILFVVVASALGQEIHYTVTDGKTDPDGIPTTAAQLCLDSSGQKTCYSPPPQDPPYGLNAKESTFEVGNKKVLILFAAQSSSGGSGSQTSIALLENRSGHLENLLPQVALSNQSEYRLWTLAGIFDMPIVVTADFMWAKGESHFASHRYRISSYAYDKKSERYLERDQFVTDKKYPGLDDAEEIRVLEAEMDNIVKRLQQKPAE